MKILIHGGDEKEAWLRWNAAASIVGKAAVALSGDRAAARAETWGLAFYSRFEDALNDRDVRGAELLDASPQRWDMAGQAIAAGKRVSLTPPFGSDERDARQALEYFGGPDRGACRHETWPHFPPVKKTEALVRKKVVGRVNSVRMRLWIAGRGGWDERLNPAYRRPPDEPPDDPLTGTERDFFEKIALAVRLLGPIEEIHWMRRPEADASDPFALTWKHKAHATYGALDFTYAPNLAIRSAWHARDDNMELTGTRGIIWMTKGWSQARIEPAIRIHCGENQFSYGNLKDDFSLAYTGAAAAFCDFVRTGKELKAGGQALFRQTLAAWRSALESRNTGERIRVDY